MKAFVYLGPGKSALEDRPKPEVTVPTEAIVKIVKTTICGTDLHLETLWDRNVAIATRLITHRFKLDNIMDAYETFGHAAKTDARKVIIEA